MRIINRELSDCYFYLILNIHITIYTYLYILVFKLLLVVVAVVVVFRLRWQPRQRHPYICFICSKQRVITHLDNTATAREEKPFIARCARVAVPRFHSCISFVDFDSLFLPLLLLLLLLLVFLLLRLQ